MHTLNDVIWIAFVALFALEFIIARKKRTYLRKHWLTAVSLALPALRLLRLARLARGARIARSIRGVRLARLIGAINRGMRGVTRGFRRRGFGYVSILAVYAFAVFGYVTAAIAAYFVGTDQRDADRLRA